MHWFTVKTWYCSKRAGVCLGVSRRCISPSQNKFEPKDPRFQFGMVLSGTDTDRTNERMFKLKPCSIRYIWGTRLINLVPNLVNGAFYYRKSDVWKLSLHKNKNKIPSVNEQHVKTSLLGTVTPLQSPGTMMMFWASLIMSTVCSTLTSVWVPVISMGFPVPVEEVP